MVASGASDLHLQAGEPPYMRRSGRLAPVGSGPIASEMLGASLDEFLGSTQREVLDRHGECETMVDQGPLGRFRVSIFRSQGRVAVAIRAIPATVPALGQLGLPEAVQNLADETSGLVLVTGPTGSGKSTTLAAMIDHINRTRSTHIITIEDPIEYQHHNQLSLVAQRQVGRDTRTFAAALNAALRQDPDVIMLGELRDLETIQIAITAAETGHLVLSTLHSSNAPSTVHRVIDVFPSEQQSQVRVQLAGVLQGVVCQQLVPGIDGTVRHPATEVLIATTAARSLIRESKAHQLPSVMEAGGAEGMHTLAASLERLVDQGLISPEEAFGRTVGGNRRTGRRP
ncbi:MAG: PilT/PilU family type 4a pilus ATPase [Actinomycetia bacterium]|nr:PilT/PilU family type 4a pilus ATPase [Actinomycetes bacterium]